MSKDGDLEHVLGCLERSDIPREICKTDAFEPVFRRLVQEHVADRIFARVEDADTFDAAADRAVEIAVQWFGEEEAADWPFTRKWLKQYITGRYHGRRKGDYFEDQEGPGRRKFKEDHPQEEANCNWRLGCDETESLEVDHIRPASLHGRHSQANLQYLCDVHNRRWKGDLLFWDTEIPVPDGG